MPNLVLLVRKLLSGLRGPLGRRALYLGVAPTIEHAPPLSRFDFDTVIDVGANKGQFALFARSRFPACRIISFEPLTEAATVYAQLFDGDERVRIVGAAVGSQRGHLVMHVAGQTDSSSPFDVGEPQTRIFGPTVKESRRVPCGPLPDFIADEDLGTRNLLKIDTQGYELEVLKGAGSLLDRIYVVYCEASFTELYVGQPLASEIVSYLFGRGFNLAGAFNIASASNLGPVQADLLFVRT